MEWEDIEERVAWLLEMAGQTEPPIDVDAIALRLGAQVDYTRRLNQEVSGCLYYGSRNVVIGVNVDKPAEHRRFTVAHECAHLVAGHSRDLHLHVAHDHEVDDVTVEEERLANHFAAVLLMPGEWVRREWQRSRKRYAVARCFRVSPGALERRLRELGIHD